MVNSTLHYISTPSHLSLRSLSLLLGWVRCGGSHWNYQGDSLGPAHWQDLCQTGQSQSPVNIQPREAQRTSFPKWKLKHYEAVLKNAEVTNNGHTLQLSPSRKEKNIPSLSGDQEVELEVVY